MSAHVLTIVTEPGAAVTAATATAALEDAERTVVNVVLEDRPSRPPGRFEDVAPSPDATVAVDPESSDVPARLAARLGAIVDGADPDVVVLHGGGTGALGAALATAGRPPPLVVAESGLRGATQTDVGRLVADHVSDAALAPTRHAVATLRSEGRTGGVHPVGDLRGPTVARLLARTPRTESDEPESIERVDSRGRIDPFEENDLRRGEYVLLALRTPDGLAADPAVRDVLRGATAGPLPVVVPWTRELRDSFATAGVEGGARRTCRTVEQPAYREFLELLAGAAGVLTDDPDVEREAFLLRTPCATLVDVTPWPRAAEAGWSVQAGTDTSTIRAAVHRCASVDRVRPRELGDDGATARLRRVVETVAATKKDEQAA